MPAADGASAFFVGIERGILDCGGVELSDQCHRVKGHVYNEMQRNSTTLEDICRLALPQNTQLLVGEQALGRAVSWACSLRPSPPAFPKLDGDELALIDMADLRRLDPKMRLDRVVQSLQGAHITAIAVLGKVDDSAVREAESHRIALLQLPKGCPTVDIERDIIRLIVDRAGYIAQRTSELQRELNQTALDGGGLDRISEIIHKFVKQPVIIMREDGHIAATSGLMSLTKEGLQAFYSSLPNVTTLRSWTVSRKSDLVHNPVGVLQTSGPPSHSTVLDGDHRNGSSLAATRPSALRTDHKSGKTGAREIVFSPIVASETDRGYCIVLRALSNRGMPATTLESIAVSEGAAAAALEWAKQHAVGLAEERMRAAFVDELLASEIADEQAWIQRGSSLGYEMTRPHVAWMVQANNITGWPDALTKFIREQGVTVPLCRREEGLLLFWPLDNAKSGRELKLIANALVTRLKGQSPSAEILVGIGRPGIGPAEWHRSQQQATESWRLGKEWNGTAVTYFGDLEFYQLLTALRGNQEAARFFHRTLGKLIRHDQEHNAELVTTLDAFFACHGNLSQTAIRLHIHRNTLTYRLDRIAEITRLDLDDPDARFSLQLAIKLQPVI